MQITRRGLITGLVGFVAAPAIVRASSLMAVKPVAAETEWLSIQFPALGGTGTHRAWLWGEEIPFTLVINDHGQITTERIIHIQKDAFGPDIARQLWRSASNS